MKITNPPVNNINKISPAESNISAKPAEKITNAQKVNETNPVDQLATGLASKIKDGSLTPRAAFDELINGLCKIFKMEPSSENRTFIVDAIKKDPQLTLYAQRIGLDLENL